MKDVDIDNRFRKREEVEYNIKHDINVKHQELKGRLNDMNFVELRMEVKEYVEKKKIQTRKEIEEHLGEELEKAKMSLLSKMYEDTSTMIIEATNRLEGKVE